MANQKWENLSEEVKQIITTLKERAIAQLEAGKIQTIRGASAELNGIYGIYQEELTQGKEDIHYLIATDTAQGFTTAEIVQTFLQQKGINNISIYTPSGLSTASTTDFSEGIDELIVWLQNQIPPLRKDYKIYFNLVGGFKSLQGYLNTIGMFYADEIIYIFEGEGSELITIPRLPIAIDIAAIEPHTVKLALMDAGAGLPPEQATDVPESLLGTFNDKRVLSTWGKLIWEQSKNKLLSQKLLEFPGIEYKDSFRGDYNQIKSQAERVKLQETLALVSCLLAQSNGDTSRLKTHGGVQYDKYENKGNMDHFRVTQGLRVSCTSAKGVLLLHRYGKEPDVNTNPW
ncbi:CRISPR-associated protein [Laspinema sp. D5]|nr:CRISPR-associated protein [Laspinema sp. D3d]MCT7971069.1 CRISPR-associated protein [Laspinema sp. D3d]